ncbi:MAG TPA: tyrosine-type recombinase/integrase [Solirubrobacteraceae bacterium]|nr:tyrosine-type recombinase/integrase [Solirubrobacteraceae bacterium]
MESVLLNAAGHRRSPATMPGYHRGRPPRNKGEEYPADPPTVEEIVAVMPAVGDRPDGHRLRALIVLLRRAGLRISEALALQESDLDRGRGAVLIRRGKGGKRREVGMAHEGVPLVVIQRQLGHANLGITSVYLQGIDSSEIITTVHGRPSPTISANAGLQMRR